MAAHVLVSKAKSTLLNAWKEDPPNFLVDVITNGAIVFQNE